MIGRITRSILPFSEQTRNSLSIALFQSELQNRCNSWGHTFFARIGWTLPPMLETSSYFTGRKIFFFNWLYSRRLSWVSKKLHNSFDTKILWDIFDFLLSLWIVLSCTSLRVYVYLSWFWLGHVVQSVLSFILFVLEKSRYAPFEKAFHQLVSFVGSYESTPDIESNG